MTTNPAREKNTVKKMSFEKLYDALNLANDALEASGIVYFVAGDTLDEIIFEHTIKTQELYLGTLRRNLTESSLRTLRVIVPEYSLMADKDGVKEVRFEMNGVTIHLETYPLDPMYENLDTVYFNYDNWNTPNPYNFYLKRRHNV